MKNFTRTKLSILLMSILLCLIFSYIFKINNSIPYSINKIAILVAGNIIIFFVIPSYIYTVIWFLNKNDQEKTITTFLFIIVFGLLTVFLPILISPVLGVLYYFKNIEIKKD